MKKLRYLVIVAIMVIDQVVKYLVRSNFEKGESVDVLGNFFSFTFVENRGAAFSIMSGQGILLTLIPLIGCAIAIWYMESMKDEHWSMYLAISLIVAGGISNLLDRVILGYVTDMFDFHFWPVFNIADIAIVVGCLFLMLYIFVYDPQYKKENKRI